MSKYFTYIYADRNVRPCTIQGYTLTTFPKVTQYILCTTREETGKRTLHNWWRTQALCIIGGEYLDNRFSTQQYNLQGKLNKDKEGGNSQPSKTPGKGQH